MLVPLAFLVLTARMGDDDFDVRQAATAQMAKWGEKEDLRWEIDVALTNADADLAWRLRAVRNDYYRGCYDDLPSIMYVNSKTLSDGVWLWSRCFSSSFETNVDGSPRWPREEDDDKFATRLLVQYLAEDGRTREEIRAVIGAARKAASKDEVSPDWNEDDGEWGE